MKSKKEMIEEGIRYWEEKDPGKWNSHAVAVFVDKKYRVECSHNYVNIVRRSNGVSMFDRLRKGL